MGQHSRLLSRCFRNTVHEKVKKKKNLGVVADASNPSTRRPSQDACCTFEASLAYIVSSDSSVVARSLEELLAHSRWPETSLLST